MSKEYPNPADNAEPLNYREQFQGREVTTRFIDPCAAASKASMDCMDKNEYDRDKCLHFFQAYRDCKSTWINQRRADRRAGRPTT
ncbi:hypothetical protein SISSUDRAFT_1026828 [Sistotremastrum suecicum HHB10207 ss-3]|uniref:Cytochrome c oxidase-assembly factor COX23, mitochondrial n=1 Tax=Sistotremastrum suecicum HHB10207 ss-3 TaxID=1314776 RepID=A0A165ZEZ7_9AGAM|nr:hypothetical protein SISSUDRAFT_1026828 [Sistotremastrum suecicum HHB10207 ss-3]